MNATTQKQFAYVDGVRAKELDKVSPPQWRFLHEFETNPLDHRRRSYFSTRSAMFKRGFIVGNMLTVAGRRALRVEWRATP